ncbi:MAG: hypothetical protein U0835_25270 [Isosphaeraceae bacterium]
MTRRPAHDRTPSPSLTPQALALSALLAWGLLPEGRAPGTLARWREPLCNALPNRADYDRMELGYYENLLEDRPEAPRGRGGPQAGAGPAFVDGRLTLKVDDVREFVLKPNLVRDPANGIPWSTNTLGMRDAEYPREKPPGTFRVALVGDSIGAGWGVDDGDGFEPQLERRWDGRSRGAGGPGLQFLNFAVPGHGPGQRWTQFAMIGWDFAPDLVVYEATPADAGWDERRLRSALARGIGFDAPVYRDVLASAGVTARGRRRVLPTRAQALRWSLLGASTATRPRSAGGAGCAPSGC